MSEQDQDLLHSNILKFDIWIWTVVIVWGVIYYPLIDFGASVMITNIIGLIAGTIIGVLLVDFKPIIKKFSN